MMTVYYHKYYGSEYKAEINWSALGSQPVDVAKLFADMLAFAVIVAAELEKQSVQ